MPFPLNRPGEPMDIAEAIAFLVPWNWPPPAARSLPVIRALWLLGHVNATRTTYSQRHASSSLSTAMAESVLDWVKATELGKQSLSMPLERNTTSTCGFSAHIATVRLPSTRTPARRPIIAVRSPIGVYATAIQLAQEEAREGGEMPSSDASEMVGHDRAHRRRCGGRVPGI